MNLSADEIKAKTIDELLKELNCSKEGLTSEEAEIRLHTYGLNQIEEKEEHVLLQFFRHFWGPIPWMIEIAAILSAILHHWSNLIIILILLIVNGLIGFFEEFRARNAVEDLKRKLAIKSIVKRDGNWTEIEAAKLVPGDLIRIRLGNIIPADAKLIDGDYLTVDQSILTGESLPVSKKVKDIVYSGSIAKQGEMDALVFSTGKHTYFGKTAKLVETAGAKSHFQKAVLQIGRYLIYISFCLAVLLVSIQLLRGDPFLLIFQFVLVLIIASIPIAMPAVLSMTMALGALKLSRMKAIVTKLESIEEMAGIDILCSDKTGTLTQNKLKLGDPIVFENGNPVDLLICGCLASKEENQDPIDLAVINGFKNNKLLSAFKQVKFTPFDPVIKRTEASIIAPEGNTFFVTKGAPQVILSLCKPDQNFERQVNDQINALGERGYRTLGVASSGDDKKSWQFLGLLTLSDPVREDAKETIARAAAHGIKIKMLTGDNIAIAKEISRELGLGTRIVTSEKIEAVAGHIDEIDGFAQVFPEHKFEIIKALQNQSHIVAMTGDGVNDAPALKQADVGIAVSDSTDAARSASSLVLTAPGLSVIINAIEEARRIFERMTSYSIYRIAETIRMMLFMVSCILIYNFYPVTPLMIILLALLNDLPIISIVTDNALLETHPIRWKMKRVLLISTAIGLVGICGSFLLVFFIKTHMQIPTDQFQTLIFLKLSMAGHQTLFVARTKHALFSKPYPSAILFTAIAVTQSVAAIFGGFGIFITAVPWSYIAYLWFYTLIWMFIADGVKNLLYKHIESC